MGGKRSKPGLRHSRSNEGQGPEGRRHNGRKGRPNNGEHTLQGVRWACAPPMRVAQTQNKAPQRRCPKPTPFTNRRGGHHGRLERPPAGRHGRHGGGHVNRAHAALSTAEVVHFVSKIVCAKNTRQNLTAIQYGVRPLPGTGDAAQLRHQRAGVSTVKGAGSAFICPHANPFEPTAHVTRSINRGTGVTHALLTGSMLTLSMPAPRAAPRAPRARTHAQTPAARVGGQIARGLRRAPKLSNSPPSPLPPSC